MTIAITPRKFNMPDSLELTLDWYQGNPLLTSYFMALSAILPDAERYMIDALREARDQIRDAQLKADITGFIGQEAHHSLAHRNVNKSKFNPPIDIQSMEKDFQTRVLLPLSKESLSERLALAAAMEHFTGMFSEYVLSNPDSFTDAPEVMSAFITWHVIEEIEHKSVVFDAFQEITGGDLALRRRFFIKAFRILTTSVSEYHKQIIQQSNYKPTWRVRSEAMSYFFGLNGLFTSNAVRAFDYLKPNFHPTQHKHEHLIENWQTRYPVVIKYLT